MSVILDAALMLAGVAVVALAAFRLGQLFEFYRRDNRLHGHTTTLLTDALRLKVPGVENYADWGAERRSKRREAEAERDALKAQLAEAVEVLRDIAEWGPLAETLDETEFRVDCERARAFLAKVKP